MNTLIKFLGMCIYIMVALEGSLEVLPAQLYQHPALFANALDAKKMVPMRPVSDLAPKAASTDVSFPIAGQAETNYINPEIETKTKTRTDLRYSMTMTDWGGGGGSLEEDVCDPGDKEMTDVYHDTPGIWRPMFVVRQMDWGVYDLDTQASIPVPLDPEILHSLTPEEKAIRAFNYLGYNVFGIIDEAKIDWMRECLTVGRWSSCSLATRRIYVSESLFHRKVNPKARIETVDSLDETLTMREVQINSEGRLVDLLEAKEVRAGDLYPLIGVGEFFAENCTDAYDFTDLLEGADEISYLWEDEYRGIAESILIGHLKECRQKGGHSLGRYLEFHKDHMDQYVLKNDEMFIPPMLRHVYTIYEIPLADVYGLIHMEQGGGIWPSMWQFFAQLSETQDVLDQPRIDDVDALRLSLIGSLSSFLRDNMHEFGPKLSDFCIYDVDMTSIPKSKIVEYIKDTPWQHSFNPIVELYLHNFSVDEVYSISLEILHDASDASTRLWFYFIEDELVHIAQPNTCPLLDITTSKIFENETEKVKSSLSIILTLTQVVSLTLSWCIATINLYYCSLDRRGLRVTHIGWNIVDFISKLAGWFRLLLTPHIDVYRAENFDYMAGSMDDEGANIVLDDDRINEDYRLDCNASETNSSNLSEVLSGEVGQEIVTYMRESELVTDSEVVGEAYDGEESVHEYEYLDGSENIAEKECVDSVMQISEAVRDSDDYFPKGVDGGSANWLDDDRNYINPKSEKDTFIAVECHLACCSNTCGGDAGFSTSNIGSCITADDEVAGSSDTGDDEVIDSSYTHNAAPATKSCLDNVAEPMIEEADILENIVEAQCDATAGDGGATGMDEVCLGKLTDNNNNITQELREDRINTHEAVTSTITGDTVDYMDSVSIHDIFQFGRGTDRDVESNGDDSVEAFPDGVTTSAEAGYMVYVADAMERLHIMGDLESWDLPGTGGTTERCGIGDGVLIPTVVDNELESLKHEYMYTGLECTGEAFVTSFHEGSFPQPSDQCESEPYFDTVSGIYCNRWDVTSLRFPYNTMLVVGNSLCLCVNGVLLDITEELMPGLETLERWNEHSWLR